MKWLTNLHELEIYKPENQSWLKGKTIGRPKASDVFTVEEMEKAGYVGIYVEESK